MRPKLRQKKIDRKETGKRYKEENEETSEGKILSSKGKWRDTESRQR